MTIKRMLIDATHPEETRVVVMADDQLEDFEVEAADRKQLKGNIYLAKITRVEPSLQAAFVDFGGNRHGFLAFSEIHPDYYQIPVSDREKLMAEQQAAERAAEEAEEADADTDKTGGESSTVSGDDADRDLETIEGNDGEDLEVRRPTPSFRNYKIQEVIKRRQIILVQVVKEERGTKGAALTTYLSLAGRYCVLMPNTARGGGVSRKIGTGKDRSRLKTVLKELEIPEGMAVIVRTAGAERNKTEIKRDYSYLVRLWESIRSLTLESTAPALVYEEANLIKRTIRDLYANDFEEIIVDGEDGYLTARNLMRLLMPSHAKRVKVHPVDATPLFQQYKVDGQLHGIYNPDVSLRSGGYIVINPTEALVSIDVNSGRSTRERNIEETALKTNLEAADEVARQLRLRELAGLVVIDFIDMDNPRNQAQVERRLETAMRDDRARIQIGRISPFGLMELSRQRMHPSLFETSFEAIPHSTGIGHRRTVASAALAALRALESEASEGRANELQVQIPTSVALYILNHKRSFLAAIESRHNVVITFKTDDSLTPPELRISRLSSAVEPTAPATATAIVAERSEPTETVEAAEEESTEEDGVRRKRRRRRRGRRPDENEDINGTTAEASDDSAEAGADATTDTASDDERAVAPAVEPAATEDDETPARRRRRGRRGGKRRGRDATDEENHIEAGVASEAGEDVVPATEEQSAAGEAQTDADVESFSVETEEAEEKRPARRRRPRGGRTASTTGENDAASEETSETVDAVADDRGTPEPAPEQTEAAATPDTFVPTDVEAPAAAPLHEPEPEPVASWQNDEAPETGGFTEDAGSVATQDDVLVHATGTDEQPPVSDQPPRQGWWQRLVR